MPKQTIFCSNFFGIIYFHVTECYSHGDVRLRAENIPQVCINGIWTYICKDGGSGIGRTLCKQLLEVSSVESCKLHNIINKFNNSGPGEAQTDDEATSVNSTVDMW